jgi:hypothetical protein
MGVATYRMAKELPPEYRGILPDADKLKEVLDAGQYMPTTEEVWHDQLKRLKSQKKLMLDE